MPKRRNVESRKYLTESEMDSLIKAASQGRHGVRDKAMALIAYRHGLRVSELIGLRMSDLDLDGGRLNVRRLKGSRSTVQPMAGPVLRAIRAWLRERPQTGYANVFITERGDAFTRFGLNYLVATWGARAGLPFKTHPHMIRHSTGFALVNRPGAAHDLRLIQDLLGHKNIAHTATYTALSAKRFEGIWDD